MKPEQMKVTSLVDSVEIALRKQILDQDIAPGSKVKEVDVALAFGVARPSAKAAIERLIAQGLLRRDVHRSARVPVLSPVEVDDLYFTRRLVEEQVVSELASRGTQVAELTDWVQALSTLPKDAPPNAYVDPDINFHLALSRALDSPRVSRIHDGLLQETRLCMAQVQLLGLLNPAVIAAEHTAIASAIHAGDAGHARVAMREHLDRARLALHEHFKASTAEG